MIDLISPLVKLIDLKWNFKYFRKNNCRNIKKLEYKNTNGGIEEISIKENSLEEFQLYYIIHKYSVEKRSKFTQYIQKNDIVKIYYK